MHRYIKSCVHSYFSWGWRKWAICLACHKTGTIYCWTCLWRQVHCSGNCVILVTGRGMQSTALSLYAWRPDLSELIADCRGIYMCMGRCHQWFAIFRPGCCSVFDCERISVPIWGIFFVTPMWFCLINHQGPYLLFNIKWVLHVNVSPRQINLLVLQKSDIIRPS